MAGRGSAPGERRGGRQKGTPNKPTFNLDAVCPTDDLTPLGFALGVLNSKSKKVSDKDRKWAAKTAMPYCHPKIRPALADAAATGNVTVEIVRFTDAQAGHLTDEQQLAELDAIGSRIQEPAQAQPESAAIDRMAVETDNRRGVREPALPPQIPSPQTPPQPPVPALVAAPVPCETRPIHRANGNGADTTQPQRVNGHPRRVNGAVVRRSDDEIRNINDRRRALSDYPRTHCVHGIG